MSAQAMAQDSKSAAGTGKQAVAPKPDPMDRDLAKLSAEIKAAEANIASTTPPPQLQVTWWTTTSAMTMSASVLLFGFLTLILASYVMRKGHPWEAVLKIFGMVLIIVMTVFLIVAGYDDKQVAPAMGLLGTIAGYLLGKDVSKKAAADTGTAAPKTDGKAAT